MTDLMQWKGRPVPWVARWSNEGNQTPIRIGRRTDGRIEASYEDGVEIRDDNGILWHREGLTRSGTPEFGEVSVYRQRAAMRHRLCQVCGTKIEGRVIRWLLHPDQIVQRDGKTLTSSPPTCDSCVNLSIVECPAMKRERMIARVLEYQLWGVYGTATRFGADGQAETTGRTYIEYGRTDYPFDYRAVIAKQQVVEWTKFVLEDR